MILPVSSNSSFQLSPYYENELNSFRRHMEWAEEFSLIFLFSSQPAIVDAFRTRLNDIYIMRATKLQRFAPEEPDQIVNDVMSLVRSPSKLHEEMSAPLWLEINRGSGSAWDKARKDLIERLNEHRELLRRNINRPVVIILPGSLASGLKEIAPDLWSIRSYSLNLDIDETAKEEQAITDGRDLITRDNRDHNVIGNKENSLFLSHVREWERLLKSGKTGSDVIHAGRNAFDAAIDAGQIQHASDIAIKALKFARNNVAESKEERDYDCLRELARTLVNVGDSKMALNSLKEAGTAYKESLEIARKIQDIAGDSPQTLRDVSISLYKLGDVEIKSGQMEAARITLNKALKITERLCNVFNENKTYKQDVERIKANIDKTKSGA